MGNRPSKSGLKIAETCQDLLDLRERGIGKNMGNLDMRPLKFGYSGTFRDVSKG
jgi:hypothetical protein